MKKQHKKIYVIVISTTGSILIRIPVRSLLPVNTSSNSRLYPTLNSHGCYDSNKLTTRFTRSKNITFQVLKMDFTRALQNDKISSTIQIG